MLIYLRPLLLTLALSLGLTPLIIRLANKLGFLVEPREDRWHKKPTALFGGIAIYLAVLIPGLIFSSFDRTTLGVFICGTLVFALGLIDDIVSLPPQAKIVGQLIIAVIAIQFGISVRIINNPIIAIPLTLLWIVGITNALNILDNMDGLAAGVALIASANIFIYSLMNDLHEPAFLACLLGGATLGFLMFNFNPAKIFMGDSGSLFLGMTLALMTIIGTWRTVPNLILPLMVPLAVMVIPIFDLALVTFNRSGHGRGIFKGGKDHSSHRLVFLGFSEKKAVLILLVISAVFGLVAILFVKLSFHFALLILVLMSVFLLFFGVYLGEVQVYESKFRAFYRRNLLISKILLYKKQILQIIFDSILIVIAYFSAYVLKYEGVIDHYNMGLIEKSLPFILLIKLSLFFIFGLYKGEWRYISIHDLIRIFGATLTASMISIVALVFLFRFEGYSRFVFINDYILTFLFISGIRIFIRVLREYSSTSSLGNPRKNGTPILVLGAGDAGEMVIREIKNNTKLGYRPVGFLDDDPEKKGKIIHGVTVLGNRYDIEDIASKFGIKKLFIAILSSNPDQFSDVIALCDKLGVQCQFIKTIIE